LPQYKTSQTDDDRQMTHCAKGTTNSTVGQKQQDNTDNAKHRVVY